MPVSTKEYQATIDYLEIIESINQPISAKITLLGYINISNKITIIIDQEIPMIVSKYYHKNQKTYIECNHPYYFIYHSKKTSIYYKQTNKQIFQDIISDIPLIMKNKDKKYQNIIQYNEYNHQFIDRLLNIDQDLLISQLDGSILIQNIKSCKNQIDIDLNNCLISEEHNCNLYSNYYNPKLPNKLHNSKLIKDHINHQINYEINPKIIQHKNVKSYQFSSKTLFQLLDQYKEYHISKKQWVFNRSVDDQHFSFHYILKQITFPMIKWPDLPPMRALIHKYNQYPEGTIYIDSRKSMIPFQEISPITSNKSTYLSDYDPQSEVIINFLYESHDVVGYILGSVHNNHNKQPNKKKKNHYSYIIDKNQMHINRSSGKEKITLEIPKDLLLNSKKSISIVADYNKTIELKPYSITVCYGNQKININSQNIQLKSSNNSIEISKSGIKLSANKIDIESKTMLSMKSKAIFKINSKIIIQEAKVFMISAKMMIIKSLIYFRKSKFSTILGFLVSAGVIIKGIWSFGIPQP